MQHIQNHMHNCTCMHAYKNMQQYFTTHMCNTAVQNNKMVKVHDQSLHFLMMYHACMPAESAIKN